MYNLFTPRWLYVVQKKDQSQLNRTDEELKIMGDKLGKHAGATMVADDLIDSNMTETKVSKIALSETTMAESAHEEHVAISPIAMKKLMQTLVYWKNAEPAK